jgi:deoxyribodipyrimidine photo-lyase
MLFRLTITLPFLLLSSILSLVNSMTMKAIATTTTTSLSSSSTSSMSTATAAATAKTIGSSRRVILHWFRLGDLRIHDNPALVHSTSLLATAMAGIHPQHEQDVIVPIFCFDSNLYGNHCATTTFTKTIKINPRRAQFIRESVIDLRQQLQTKCNSQLLVAYGTPANVFHHVIDYVHKTYTSNIRIVCQNEVAVEEIRAVKDVRAVIKSHFPLSNEKLIIEIWGSTMYDRFELPYDRDALYHMPNGFTPFRTAVEKKCKIAKPFTIPRYLPFPHDWPTTVTTADDNHTMIASTTYMPTLDELGYTAEQIREVQTHDERGVMVFKGGETAGLQRVQQYIWDQDLLQNYYNTRNGMIGANYSSKFSPWLAHGCISPRHIVNECSKYEKERVKNKSTYWLVFELLWRDFCKFFALKHKSKIFKANGILQNKNDEKREWDMHEPSFDAWKVGKTGYPLVDANMREMLATGFMSNRGRQNVASFLALDLKYDWRYGADWFESNLVDYDVYSNWVVSFFFFES